jgi:hypothetical protein
MIIGEHLDDDRHLVRRVALEGQMLEGHLLAADARALVDRALDGIAGNAFLAGLFTGGKKPRVAGGVGPAMLGRDHDFLQIFSGRLRFSQRIDLPFSEQPLTSHG